MKEIESYDAAFLAGLVRDFDIPPEKSARLGEAINRAADEWRRDDGLKAPWELIDHIGYRRLYDDLVSVRDALPMLNQEALRQLKDIQDFVEYGDEAARIVDTSGADDEGRLAIRLGDSDDDMREDFSPARLARMLAAMLDAVKYGSYTSPPKPRADAGSATGAMGLERPEHLDCGDGTVLYAGLHVRQRTAFSGRALLRQALCGPLARDARKSRKFHHEARHRRYAVTAQLPLN